MGCRPNCAKSATGGFRFRQPLPPRAGKWADRGPWNMSGERDKRTGRFPPRPKPSAGDGWGGPAKGAGKRIASSDDARLTQARNTPERRASKEERAERLLDHLENLAYGAERQETQVTATVAFLNRALGTPTATVRTEITERSVIRAPEPIADADEWARQYAPKN